MSWRRARLAADCGFCCVSGIGWPVFPYLETELETFRAPSPGISRSFHSTLIRRRGPMRASRCLVRRSFVWVQANDRILAEMKGLLPGWLRASSRETSRFHRGGCYAFERGRLFPHRPLHLFHPLQPGSRSWRRGQCVLMNGLTHPLALR